VGEYRTREEEYRTREEEYRTQEEDSEDEYESPENKYRTREGEGEYEILYKSEEMKSKDTSTSFYTCRLSFLYSTS
jgi:hypothetical protein